MLLANNLKFLRKRHGYTQSQVALLLEINRSTYAYYELGETQPSLLTLVKLARLYDVTTDYLLGIQPEEKPPTPFEQELLSLVRKYWGESSES